MQVGSVYSLGVSFAGNGDVTSANDSVNGNWAYGYDAFNRLTSAAKTGVSYTWDYDRFGNRWHQTQVGVGAQALTFNQNNQITNPGFIYDAAGNLMMDNLNCYSYDAENRLVSTVPETSPGTGVCGAAANGTDYLYDPDGRRVAKMQNGAIAKQSYYDAAGQEIAETNGSGTLTRAEIFAGGRHLATWNPAGGGTTYFNHSDWLGTERVRTNSSGSPCETIYSLPFGDGMNWQPVNGGCGDPSPNHFTGKERDSETGLDYFGARYNASSLGRFMSPDPDNIGTDQRSPQSWNGYTYVLDNPVMGVDPDGLDCIYTSDVTDKSVMVTVERGVCTGKGGSYVSGTVDVKSLSYNGSDLKYSFSNSETGVAGAGVISLEKPEGPSPLLLAAAQGAQMAGPWVNGFWAATSLFIGTVGPRTLLEPLPMRLGLGGQPAIGKMGDLGSELGAGERELALPDENTPKANWAQNSRRLRQEMAEGRPIKDATALRFGGPDKMNTGFLRAERNLLQNHGWTYSQGYWYPPGW